LASRHFRQQGHFFQSIACIETEKGVEKGIVFIC
jgi:hypothetical protein